VEQQLTAGLGERQITELVENKEVEPGEAIGDTALPPGAGFSLQPVDQVDCGMEAATGAGADAGAGDGDRKMAPAAFAKISRSWRSRRFSRRRRGQLLALGAGRAVLSATFTWFAPETAVIPSGSSNS
jgi:hypothetical protein